MSGRISNPARCLALRSGHSEVVAGSIATKSVVRGWGAGIRIGLFFVCTALAPCCIAQGAIPDWCRALPHPEYKNLQRIPISDAWFEVYKPAPGVFAIYEPHQSEETIGYLITGTKRALLFDTGMGISDVKKITTELTKLPIIVMNSHTQAEIPPDQICGALPKGFDANSYTTRPWKITKYIHDGEKIDLGGRTIEVIPTPGHTPDAISLFDRANGLLFTGDTYYPAPIWLFRPETDLDAYAASIRRLAGLAPQVKVVMGAHNIPVASPTLLPRLVAAFDAVRAGK